MGTTALAEDIHSLGAGNSFAAFDGTTVLITGSTGLIGSLFAKGALSYNEQHGGAVRVIAVARNAEKANRVFADYLDCDALRIVVADIAKPLDIDEPVHWISHGASLTSSADFARKPVEVACTELDGTRNVLELARAKNVRGMVYLSSLEVYGDIPKDHGDVREDDGGALNRFVPRNSYPCAKQMCEALCTGYASEYGVPVKVARLAQTFGAGVAANDGRVFAQFARAAMKGEPIVMRTPGVGCRCYCYTSDAVRGLLAILEKGQAGQAYNVANPATYCSVREMAEMVVGRYAQGGVSLEFDFPEDLSAFGFAAPSYVKLNSDKLADLGWSPEYDLPEMYDRLIASMREAC